MAAGGQTGGMGGAQTAAPGGGMGVGTGQPPATGSMQMPSYMQQPMMGMMGGYGGMRGGMQQPMMGGYGQSPFMGGGFGGDYGGYGQSPFMGGMRGPRGGMGFNPYGGGMGFNPYGGIDRAYDGSPARDFMFRAQSMPASPGTQFYPSSMSKQDILEMRSLGGQQMPQPTPQQAQYAANEGYRSIPAAPRAPMTQQDYQNAQNRMGQLFGMPTSAFSQFASNAQARQPQTLNDMYGNMATLPQGYARDSSGNVVFSDAGISLPPGVMLAKGGIASLIKK